MGAVFPALASGQPAIRPVERPAVRADRADQTPPGLDTRKTVGTPALPTSSTPRQVTPFVLRQVEIEGSSLPARSLAAAYAPYIGQTIDSARLQAISDALAAVYARADIAFYTLLIPSQTYAGGVLRVQVLEGFVQGAVIDKAVTAKARRRIADLARPVLAERPLRRSTLQRAISLMRDTPGFAPDIVLDRAAQPGALSLRVGGKVRRLQAAMGVNTRGTAYLGRTQGQLDLTANSLAIGGDQLRLGYAQPIGKTQYRAYSLAYAAPLNASGLSGQVNLGRLTTQPRAFPLKGVSDSFGGAVSYQAVRDFQRSLVVSGGLDGVNSDNAFLGFTFASDRIRTLRGSVAYSRQSATRFSSVGATVSAGVDGLGAATLNPGSRLDFRKLNLRAADTRALRGSLILRTNLTGQWTGDTLPGSEQMAAGGDEFGRAYETAIIAGDTGYAASGELAWRSPRLPPRLQGAELYGFIDGARLRYRSRGGFPGSNPHLASLGGGVRAPLGDQAIAQVEAVRGLNNPVAYENREVWRLTLSLRSVLR